jgi:uncharacterized protein YqcC (DUF446 family)
MLNKNLSVAELLLHIEDNLRQLGLWQLEIPSDEALSSTQPFAVDTLNFPQWLQFIFIPRLTFMVENALPLPTNSSVAPMAEEYFGVLPLKSAELIGYLHQLDQLLTQ